jgi:transcriptional regulator with XRE-family HTH domain
MNKKSFKTLREFKDYHHLTAEQLGDLLGVDREWIYQLLGRKTIPGSQLARRIAEKCRVPLESILFPEKVEEDK